MSVNQPQGFVRKAVGLTNTDTSQVQIQGSEMANPNIYPIDELLKCMKGPVLQIQKLQDLHDTGQQQNIQEEYPVKFQH